MDKETDFSFMKTGVALTDDGLTTDYKQTVVSMLTLFGENAVTGGALYTKHAKRQVITPEDIKRSLMLEVFVYTKRPDVLARVEHIRKELFSGEPDDSDDSSEADESGGDGLRLQPFTESGCSCSLCHCLNTIYERWATWEPQTQLERLLKKHIDAIET